MKINVLCPKLFQRPGRFAVISCCCVLASASLGSAGSFVSDFNSGLPAGATLYGNAAVGATGGYTNSGCLKLVNAEASQSGSAVLNDLDPGVEVNGLLARFKAYVGGGSSADGFSFNFATDLPAGGFAEEGAGSGLSVCFDTFSNNSEPTGIEVKIGGYSLGNNPDVVIRQGTFVDVVVHLKPNGYLDVIYDGYYVFTNQYTGFAPGTGFRVGFGARTGGSVDNHWIDDLNVTTYTNNHPFVDVYQPIGRSARPDVPIAMVLMDYFTSVDAGKIALKVDGATVTPTVIQSSPYTTVSYTPPVTFTPLSSHTVDLTFADNSAVPQTNNWSYEFRLGSFTTLDTNLVAAPALVSANPGFKARINQIDVNRGPTVQRAENQLAGLLINADTGLPYENRAIFSTTNEQDVINYSSQGFLGNFLTELPQTIPGLPGVLPDLSSAGDTNAALDFVTYIYLTNGFHTFGVNSSDGFRLTAASSPDIFALELMAFDGVRAAADSTITFVVQKEGWYPFRLLYFIGGLEAVNPTADVPGLEFFSIDASNTKTLINDATVAGYHQARLPAETLPYVRATTPGQDDTGISKNTAIGITVVDGSITVDPVSANVALLVNGASVSPMVSYGVTNGGITLISYQPASPLPLNSSNYVEFAFSDSAAHRRTNSFHFRTENVLTQIFAIAPGSTTNATWAKWMVGSGTERGLAYNPKTGHMLLVSRNAAAGTDGPDGCGVGIFDGTTGQYLGKLSITLPDATNIKDNGLGLFKLNMIDVAEDGVIYACALQTSWASAAFVIYRWQNEDANPTIAVASPQLGGGTRAGDAFVVRGSGAGTEIIATGNTTATVLPLFTTVDGTNFTGTAVNPGVTASAIRLGLAFGCGKTVYGMTSGAGNPMRQIAFTGAPSTAGLLVTNYTIVDYLANSFIGPIGLDLGNQRLIGAATAAGVSPHSMNLFDFESLVPGTVNNPVDSKPFPVNVGTFGTGSVDFTPDGSRVYTLDTGSGIICFGLAPKLAAPMICAHPTPHIVPGPGSVGFMDVGAVGSNQKYQWRKNGVDLPGATSRTLDIYNVQDANLAFYSVVITNSLGRQTSNPAMLDTQMGFAQAPQSQVVAIGGSAGLSAMVTNGLTPYTYQWSLNSVAIQTATGSSYFISPAQQAQAGAYTVTVTDALGQAVTSPTAVVTIGAVGTGTGLMAEYFNQEMFAGNTPSNAFVRLPTVTRVDETVDFDWGTAGSPDPMVNIDYFTARWHGQVEPIYTQPYTFYVRSDDGARLWVDGRLLVNTWQPQAPAEFSGTIDLAANHKYDLVLEYFEKASGAVVQLSWSSTNQVKEIIPKSQLYPATAPLAASLTSTLNFGTNLVFNWVGSGTLESATNIVGPWVLWLEDAVGPYTNAPSEPARYYRLLSGQKP